MPRGSFTAARHFNIPDGQTMDFKQARGQESFAPQAVMCNSSSDQNEQAAGYAYIDGYLFGENDTHRAIYRIDIGRPVGLAFAKIYAEGTTARGIKLLSEV